MTGHGCVGKTFVVNGTHSYYRPQRAGEPSGLIIFESDTLTNDIVYYADDTRQKFNLDAFRAYMRQVSAASRRIGHDVLRRAPPATPPRPPQKPSALIRWMAKALTGGQK